MSLRTMSIFRNGYWKLNENSSVTIKIRMQKLLWESVLSWDILIYIWLSNILMHETAENKFSTLIEALMPIKHKWKWKKKLYNIHFIYYLDENNNFFR